MFYQIQQITIIAFLQSIILDQFSIILQYHRLITLIFQVRVIKQNQSFIN